jgi:hypothetical protein
VKEKGGGKEQGRGKASQQQPKAATGGLQRYGTPTRASKQLHATPPSKARQGLAQEQGLAQGQGQGVATTSKGKDVMEAKAGDAERDGNRYGTPPRHYKEAQPATLLVSTPARSQSAGPAQNRHALPLAFTPSSAASPSRGSTFSTPTRIVALHNTPGSGPALSRTSSPGLRRAVASMEGNPSLSLSLSLSISIYPSLTLTVTLTLTLTVTLTLPPSLTLTVTLTLTLTVTLTLTLSLPPSLSQSLSHSLSLSLSVNYYHSQIVTLT